MRKTIRIVQLEDKYLSSAIDCLLTSQMENGNLQYDLMMSKEEIEVGIFNQLNEKYNQKRTLAAVDVNDEVVGIITALDIQDFYKYIDTNTQSSLFKKLNSHFFFPLQDLKSQRGKVLVANQMAVKKEYENMKIGQILLDRYIKLSQYLGYSLITGLVYNPKLATLLMKINAKNYQSYTLEEVQEQFPQTFKTKFQNDVYIYGLQLECHSYEQNSSEYHQETPRL